MMPIQCKICVALYGEFNVSIPKKYDVESDETMNHAKRHFYQMQMSFLDLLEGDVFAQCFPEVVKSENDRSLIKDEKSQKFAMSDRENDNDAR